MRCLQILVAALICAPASFAQQAKPSVPSKTGDDSQLYRNSALGFRYRTPYGWVDRTKDLQEQDEQKQDQSPGTHSGTGDVLLAVFERPPEAAGDTVNSAVLIASESAASYPGLNGADDYLDQLDEITTAKGFKPDGDPQDVTVNSHAMVRADFAKALNDKVTMYQSTLVLLEKKQIVSFTFIAGSKDEIEELMDGLSFATGPVRKRP